MEVTMTLDPAKLKPGDRIRVTGLPAGKSWGNVNRETGQYISNGEIVVVSDPPTGPACNYGDAGKYTSFDDVIRYKYTNMNYNCWIPGEWVEPVGDANASPTACTCTIDTL